MPKNLPKCKAKLQKIQHHSSKFITDLEPLKTRENAKNTTKGEPKLPTCVEFLMKTFGVGVEAHVSQK